MMAPARPLQSRRAWLRGAATLCFLLALATSFIPTTTAHAELASSVPAQGTHLDAAPAEVRVTLTEPIETYGHSIKVIDSASRRVDLGDATASAGANPVLSVRLPESLPAGPYRIVWTALSSTDGHPSGGTIGFAIGDAQAPAAGASEGVPAGSAVARFIAYAGLSLAFGAAAFLLWMAPAGYPTMVARVALLVGSTLHASGTALLAAHTWSASNIGVGAVVQNMRAGDFGVAEILMVRVGLAVAAWILAVVWTVRPVVAGTPVVTALLLASALGSARLGHPYMQGPAVMALDFLHLVSAGTWVGGLVLLLVLVAMASRQGTDVEALRRAGIRFGTLAMVCVAVLALTGLVVAVAVIGVDTLADPGRLLATPYALFLLGKVVLAAAMVALAALNRYVILEAPTEEGMAGGLQRMAHKASGGRLTPGLAAGRFRRMLAIEAGVGVAVLVLAALLTSVSPPAAAGPGPVRAQGLGDYYSVAAEMPTPHVGAEALMHIRIAPLDAAEAPVVNNTCGRSGNDSCVTVSVLYPGQQEPEESQAHPSDGLWMAHEGIWGQAGNVTATVTISTAEHFEDRVVLRFEIEP